MSSAANWCQKALRYEFAEAGLLTLALTHKSASAANNERLEFLGDAVLDLVIADALYAAQPEADEGSLSRLRAALVRSDTLADLARSIGLNDWLSLGAGERRSGGFQRASMMADALEALFGAIYLDGGYESAARVILHVYSDRLSSLPEAAALKDAKTRLQEALQQQGRPLPLYELLAERGPSHSPEFHVGCSVPLLELASEGRGTSRRKAEQQAAECLLKMLQKSE